MWQFTIQLWVFLECSHVTVYNTTGVFLECSHVTVYNTTGVILGAVRNNDKLINTCSVICQANKALKKVCSEDGHHFQDNDSDFLVNNQPIPSMYYDHIHLNRAGTYAFWDPAWTLYLVQCSTQVVERTLSNKVRIRGHFQQGSRIPTFTTYASSSIDDETRCLVLEDQHEHSNSTRNSCSRLAKSSTIPNHEAHCLPQSFSNCSNVTSSNVTCH